MRSENRTQVISLIRLRLSSSAGQVAWNPFQGTGKAGCRQKCCTVCRPGRITAPTWRQHGSEATRISRRGYQSLKAASQPGCQCRRSPRRGSVHRRLRCRREVECRKLQVISETLANARRATYALASLASPVVPGYSGILRAPVPSCLLPLVGLAPLCSFSPPVHRSPAAFHHRNRRMAEPGFYAVGRGGERFPGQRLVQRVESRHIRDNWCGTWSIPRRAGIRRCFRHRAARSRRQGRARRVLPRPGQRRGSRQAPLAACCFQPANLVPWVLEFHHNLTLPGNWGPVPDGRGGGCSGSSTASSAPG